MNTTTTNDPELKRIDDWREWFVSGHRQRLKDLNLPKDQHDRELADVMRTAAAVTERMRSDWLSRSDYLARRT
jgi:hypothetical protein